jgi:hypothetical protein
MPIENRKLNPPDPFVMNEDTVNKHVAAFLISNGFKDVHYLSGKARGVDVYGRKGNLEVFVESKGSHGNKESKERVFKDDQLWDHLCKQVCKLMIYKDENKDKQNFIVAANPDIPRIKKFMSKIEKSVEELKIIKMWVKENGDIILDVPGSIKNEVKGAFS